MAGPIYQFWEGKPTEAWYQLSKEEQDMLSAKIQETLRQVGGRRVLNCFSRWASEDTVMWGVDEFPDIEAVQKLTRLQEELNWYRYVDARTLLGTKWE
jgi:hypothetical protein